jgi:hypothetical protein
MLRIVALFFLVFCVCCCCCCCFSKNVHFMDGKLVTCVPVASVCGIFTLIYQTCVTSTKLSNEDNNIHTHLDT